NSTILVYTGCQININANEITNIAVADKIGTKRLPLKNANAVGNLVSLNLLYIAAVTKPQIIPTNTLLISPKAKFTFSSGICNVLAIDSVLKTFVKTKNDTSPLNAAAPFLSFDIPKAKPTANKIGKLSRIAKPPFAKKLATLFPSPLIAPGSINDAIPSNKPATG